MRSFQESIDFHKTAEKMSATLLAYYPTMAVLFGFFQSFSEQLFCKISVNSCFCIWWSTWNPTHCITWMIRKFACTFSSSFENWGWELEMTDQTLFSHHIKPHGNKKGVEFLVSKKFYTMVKSAFTRWLWDVNGMTTTLLKVKILKFPQTKITQIHAFLKKATLL